MATRRGGLPTDGRKIKAARRRVRMARRVTLAERVARIESSLKDIGKLFESIVGLPNVPGCDGKDTLISRVRRMEESSRAAAEAGWLPMDSAPHDGTRVLLLARLGNSAPTVQVGTRASIAGATWVIEGFGIYSAFKFLGWQPLPAVPKYYEAAAPESAGPEWRPISELPCGTRARLRNADHYTYGGYGPHGGFVDGAGNPLTWRPTEWQPLYAS